MIFGYDYLGHRTSLHNTPYYENKGARLGDVIGTVLLGAVNSQLQMSTFETRITSYITRNRVSADPNIARAYVRELDTKEGYMPQYERDVRDARQVIDQQPQLRLTGIESERILGQGVLRAVNYKDGSLLLEGDESSQVVSFTEAEYRGRGKNRILIENNLSADLEVLNPDEVDIFPLVERYRL